MATKPNTPQTEPPRTNRGPLILLAIGSIAVAALVGWALTRTVEPAIPAATSTFPTAATGSPQTATDVIPSATTSTTATQPPTQDNDDVARIQPGELKALIDRGGVTVLDVRDSVSYTNSHIPGAIHIPFARVQAESANLPKDKPIVAYCT